MVTKPAILGGDKAVNLDFTRLKYIPNQNQRDAVSSLMLNGRLSTHTSSDSISELESKFKDHTGSRYALSFCNCTSALLSAFFASGLGPGDEVIVPSYSYFASVMPLLHTRATPIFCDVETKTLSLDPNEVRKKINSKTRAIIVTTMTGLPPNLPELRRVADSAGIILIEDAARGLGGMIDNRAIGTYGDITCFSLNSAKVLPAGEGGMLTTNSELFYNRAHSLGHPVYKKPTLEDYTDFQDSAFGFKHNIHPLAAAMANALFPELQSRCSISNTNYRQFVQMLREFEFIEPLQEIGNRGAWSGIYFFLKPKKLGFGRDLFVKALKAEGCRIQGEYSSNVLYKNPVFAKSNLFLKGFEYSPKYLERFPIADRIQDNLLVCEGLCSYTLDTLEFVEAYRHAISKISEFWSEIKEISHE